MTRPKDRPYGHRALDDGTGHCAVCAAPVRPFAGAFAKVNPWRHVDYRTLQERTTNP